MKTCASCKEAKPFVDFPAVRANNGRPHSYCRPCIRLKAAATRKAHADVVAARQARRYREDRERRLAYQRAYAQAHPEAVQKSSDNRRAREAAAFIEVVDRDVVWARDLGVCHICSLPADVNDWHLDHVIPLAKGGLHSYDNTAVSHPACNLVKGARVLPNERLCQHAALVLSH